MLLCISPPLVSRLHHGIKASRSLIRPITKTMSTSTAPGPNKAQSQLQSSKPQLDIPPAPLPQPQKKKSNPTLKDFDSLTAYLEKVSLANKQPEPTAPSKPKGKQADKRRGQPKKKMASRPRDAKVIPSKESGGIPNPSPIYLQQTFLVAEPLQVPQNLLVVIDLNGTILYRPNRANPTKFVARPHALRFLEYCINTFHVVIWSSARPENVQALVDSIISPELRLKVLAIWGRDTFGLSRKDYNLRTQCYKRLARIWTDPHILRTHPGFVLGERWDQTNTVLVDDSLEKGRSEPFNLIEIPEFLGDLDEPGEILPQVHDYLNYLSLHSNVSACLKNTPFRAQIPRIGGQG